MPSRMIRPTRPGRSSAVSIAIAAPVWVPVEIESLEVDVVDRLGEDRREVCDLRRLEARVWLV